MFDDLVLSPLTRAGNKITIAGYTNYNIPVEVKDANGNHMGRIQSDPGDGSFSIEVDLGNPPVSEVYVYAAGKHHRIAIVNAQPHLAI